MKIAALFLFVTAFASCGSEPPPGPMTPLEGPVQISPFVDVVSTQSPLVPGSYCESTLPMTPGCGGYNTLIGTVTCNIGLHSVTTSVYFSYGQYYTPPGPILWKETTYSSAAALVLNAGVLNLQCGLGSRQDILMTSSTPGLLYSSSSTACHLERFDSNGNLLGADAVTILGGNWQYTVSTAGDRNGRWSLWLSAPNDPANGVCGNVAFSWKT